MSRLASAPESARIVSPQKVQIFYAYLSNHSDDIGVLRFNVKTTDAGGTVHGWGGVVAIFGTALV